MIYYVETVLLSNFFDFFFREVQLERIPTSTAAKDLKAFCEEHAADDYLLSPNFNVENPFKEKKSCVIV